VVKRLRWTVTLGLLAGGILLAGTACGGDDSPSPPAATVEPTPTPEVTAAEPTATSTATATATTAPAPSPTPVPEPVRAASYGDLTYAITDVVETNETWRTYGGSQTQLSNDRYLYVHLDVTNRLANVPLTFQSSLFYLETGTTRLEALRLWSQPASALAAPGTTVTYITGFQIPANFDAAGARLVIAESGREPASVVIEGPPEAQRFPMEALVGDEASPVSAGRGCNDLVVDAVRAVVDLDAGLDAPGISGNVDGGRRARTGERLLRFEMIAKGGSSTCALLGEYFRLEVDGSALAPANHLATSVSAGESKSFTLVFRIPADAREIALLAGEPGGNVKPFPIMVGSAAP
jgi:hypothetical protein